MTNGPCTTFVSLISPVCSVFTATYAQVHTVWSATTLLTPAPVWSCVTRFILFVTFQWNELACNATLCTSMRTLPLPWLAGYVFYWTADSIARTDYIDMLVMRCSGDIRELRKEQAFCAAEAKVKRSPPLFNAFSHSIARVGDPLHI